MTTMITEVYDALLAAGAPEEKARKAAEALAEDKQKITRLEVLVAVQLSLALGSLWGIIKLIGEVAKLQ